MIKNILASILPEDIFHSERHSISKFVRLCTSRDLDPELCLYNHIENVWANNFFFSLGRVVVYFIGKPPGECIRIFGRSPKLQTRLRKKGSASGISAFRDTSKVIAGDLFTPFSALLFSVLAPSSSRSPLPGGKMAARSSPFTFWPLTNPFQKILVPNSSNESPVLHKVSFPLITLA